MKVSRQTVRASQNAPVAKIDQLATALSSNFLRAFFLFIIE
jgi:hypothetical protein